MPDLWTPGALVCRVCGARYRQHHHRQFQTHLLACVERNAEFIDALRPAPSAPFEGDPELAAFAMAEGDVYNRRPGTRKPPR